MDNRLAEVLFRIILGYRLWLATGTVWDTFQNLITEIKDHLQNRQGAENSVVTWSIYMMGKTRSTAIPTVLFFSTRSDRKAAMKQIQESGILSSDPSMRIAGCRQDAASKSRNFTNAVNTRQIRSTNYQLELTRKQYQTI